jgi:hypothetical protein
MDRSAWNGVHNRVMGAIMEHFEVLDLALSIYMVLMVFWFFSLQRAVDGVQRAQLIGSA